MLHFCMCLICIHIHVHTYTYIVYVYMYVYVLVGVVQIAHLFWNHGFSEDRKLKYIQLLEKFEVALKISNTQVQCIYMYMYINVHLYIRIFTCTVCIPQWCPY